MSDMFASVVVHLPGIDIDSQIPVGVPVEDALTELVPTYIEKVKAKRLPSTWLEDPTAHWQLASVTREPFDRRKTLAEQGVGQGSQLWLTKDHPDEEFPAVIDDPAEAIVYAQRQKFAPWSPQRSAVVASFAMVFGTLTVCLAALFALTMDAAPIYARFGVAGVFAFIAIVGSVMLAVTRDRTLPGGEGVPIPTLCGLVSVYLFAGTAVILAIAKPLSLWHLAAAASVWLLLSLLFVFTHPHAERVTYGFGAASVVLIIVPLVNLFFPYPPRVVAWEMVTLAMMLLLLSQRASQAFAGFELPYVPATGEDLMRGESTDLIEVSRRSTSRRAIESIVNQHSKVLAENRIQTGLSTGLLTVMVFGFGFTGWFLDADAWLFTIASIGVVLAVIYRGKSHTSAELHTLILSGAGLMWVAFLIGASASDYAKSNLVQIGVVLGVGIVSVAISIGWSLRQKVIISPVVRRTLEWIERLLYAMPLVYLAFALDLYTKARNR